MEFEATPSMTAPQDTEADEAFIAKIVVIIKALIVQSPFLKYLFHGRGHLAADPPIIYGGFIRDTVYAAWHGELDLSPAGMADLWPQIQKLRADGSRFHDMDLHLASNMSRAELEKACAADGPAVGHKVTTRLSPRYQSYQVETPDMPGETILVFEIHCCNDMRKVDYTINTLMFQSGRIRLKSSYVPNMPDIPVWLVVSHCVNKILMPFNVHFMESILAHDGLELRSSTKKLFARGNGLSPFAALEADSVVDGCSFTVATTLLLCHVLRIRIIEDGPLAPTS